MKLPMKLPLIDTLKKKLDFSIDITNIRIEDEENELFDPYKEMDMWSFGSRTKKQKKTLANNDVDELREELQHRETSFLRRLTNTVVPKAKQANETFFKNPKFVRKRDKFAFIFGVFLTIFTAYYFGKSQDEKLISWYGIWAWILLIIRFFYFHSTNEHYFMLDFCYLANYMLLFYLYVYPTSPYLFILNFANANGPLMTAVFTWRNSLIFHDLDKITSSFIHIFPPLVTYGLRWSKNKDLNYATCLNENCDLPITTIVGLHMVFFFFWVFFYLYKTEVIDKKVMSEKKELITSFRWMTRDHPDNMDSFGYRALALTGEKNTKIVFYVYQSCYHFCVVLPSVLMYKYQRVHQLFVLLCLTVCIFNGANFYIEKFSKSYLQWLAALEKKAGEMMDKKKAEKGEIKPQTPKPMSPSVSRMQEIEEEEKIISEISKIMEKTLQFEEKSNKIEDIKGTLAERKQNFEELKKKLSNIQANLNQKKAPSFFAAMTTPK